MKGLDAAVIKNVIVGFVVFVLATSSFHCIESPMAPIAPTSDIKLEGISIVDVTRSFGDFLVKDTTLARNSDGTVSYIHSQSLAAQGIPAIKLQPQPASQQVSVGVFSVPGMPAYSTSMTVTQMGIVPMEYPGVNAIGDGLPPVFPSYYVSRPGDTMNYSSQFDFLAVNSGTLSLQFSNNLPLRVAFNRPIILRNNQLKPFVDTSVIAVFNVGIVDSFANYNGSSSLAGKLIRSSVKFDSISFTTQQRSTPFSLKLSNGVSAQFTSTALLVDSAATVIPPQQVTSINDSVMVVDSLTVIQSASFTSGKIIFHLENNLGIDVSAKLTVNEMKQNGPLTLSQTLTAKQKQDITLNFNTMSFQADPPIKQYGTSVKFSVGITTIDSKGAKKLVTKNDYVKASFIPQDPLVVHSVVGKIKPTVVNISSGAGSGIKATDLNNLSAQVALKGMQVTLQLPITGGFPTDYHLAFIAKNSKKKLVDSIVLISGSSSAVPRINPAAGTAAIHLADIPGFSFDNFISRFFPDVPDSFYVQGTMTMDPPDIFAQPIVYSIYDTTKVYPSIDMNLPVAVGIKNGVLTDVLGLTKDQIPKDMTKSISQGSLTFYFYNKLPFKMFCHLNFLGNYNPKTRKEDTLLYIVPSDTIQPAVVDIATGLTTGPTFSRLSVTLNNSQMVQFNAADSLYISLGISTSNNGQVVRVRDTDYIRVYAKGDLTYTIGKQ